MSFFAANRAQAENELASLFQLEKPLEHAMAAGTTGMRSLIKPRSGF
jgi:hypothetical protein